MVRGNASAFTAQFFFYGCKVRLISFSQRAWQTMCTERPVRKRELVWHKRPSVPVLTPVLAEAFAPHRSRAEGNLSNDVGAPLAVELHPRLTLLGGRFHSPAVCRRLSQDSLCLLLAVSRFAADSGGFTPGFTESLSIPPKNALVATSGAHAYARDSFLQDPEQSIGTAPSWPEQRRGRLCLTDEMTIRERSTATENLRRICARQSCCAREGFEL